jgi:hypothetical protein
MVKMGILLIKMIKEKKTLRVTGWLRHSVMEYDTLLLGHWFQFSLNQKQPKAVMIV